MSVKKLFVPAVILLLVGGTRLSAQQTRLARSTPEAEGVSSKAISIFLDSIASSNHEFHSFMFVRHGKVIAEGWWKPYRPDLRHTLYSLSKSFTATAVGFAQAEKKLSVNDKVISFFPDHLPDTVSPLLEQLTVKDLLTMSVGQEPEPIAVIADSNWVKGFLAAPVKHRPGTKFLYNSMATYMLSAIVQKVTGEKILDYLQPRLFDPLSIDKPDWETDPKGINTGGWGLRLKTEDIAKFAQLFLQKGKWNGKQVLPEGWTEEASKAHIIQHPELPQARRDSSDWEQGYGYQMWRCRNNAYRGDGAYGQYAIVMPEKDAVIAITSETPDMQGELNLIWQILLPAMKDEPLTADKRAASLLKAKLAKLELPVKKDASTATPQQWRKAATFDMSANDLGIRALGFRFDKKNCEMTMKTDTSQHTFNFAINEWRTGKTREHGPYLVRFAKNNLNGLPDFQVAAEYSWIDENTLELVLRYIESPHSETYTIKRSGDKINVQVSRSFSTGRPDDVVEMVGSRNSE